MTRPALYELWLQASAVRTLRAIPERYAVAVVEFMTGPLLRVPHRIGGRLDRELTGYLSARVGEYRVVYRIVESQHLVRVVRIDHRADVYRPR